jgi:hypothetical protein
VSSSPDLQRSAAPASASAWQPITPDMARARARPAAARGCRREPASTAGPRMAQSVGRRIHAARSPPAPTAGAPGRSTGAFDAKLLCRFSGRYTATAPHALRRNPR